MKNMLKLIFVLLALHCAQSMILMKKNRDTHKERELGLKKDNNQFLKRLKKLKGVLNNVKRTFRELKLNSMDQVNDLVNKIREDMPSNYTKVELDQAEHTIE